MHDPLIEPSRTRRVVETALAAGLILFRLLRCPPGDLWRDWMLILAAFWIFSVWGRRGRLWPTLTLVTMSLLLCIYLHGQLGHTLVVLLP
jgi:hypothetical protein